MKILLLIYSGLTWDDPAIAGTCVALQKSGIPIHHCLIPKALIGERISNWLSTQVIAMSLNVKRVLLELDRVSPEKMILAYHAVDVSRFTEANPDLVRSLTEVCS